MEEELNMRRAEVEALRNYYQKNKQALNELEEVLKQVRSDKKLSDREKQALDNLLGDNKWVIMHQTMKMI